jgi:hypothetical protein
MPPADTTTALQTISTSVLSQDVITTSSVLVDAESPSPIAAFRNPASAGVSQNAQPEALAIVDGALTHVKRNPATDGGWEAVPLFGGQSAEEVAAGTAYALSTSATAYGFAHDGTTLQWTQLESDGATWTEPTALPTFAAHLDVAYSPEGQLVLYGATNDGNLLLAWQPSIGGAFESGVCDLGVDISEGDFSLCMTDEQTWWLGCNNSGTPNVLRGILGATAPETTETVTELQGQLEHVALAYNAASQNTVMFLFVDTSGQLHVWALSAVNTEPVVQPIPNSSVRSATGYVSQDGTLHVYSLDDENSLWVLHQNSTQPWNQDATPNWASYIALDTQIQGVTSDMNPADAPALFALDAAVGALRFHTQDPATQMWASGPIQQAGTNAAEVVRFRTEVSVFDEYSNPQAFQPVSVQVASGGSAVDLWVSGAVYPVDATTPVQLTTDAYGKLTLASLTTTDMAAPNLVISAAGLVTPSQVSPAGPLHSYLSGSGILNPTNPSGPLPVFDAAGETLTNAQVGDSPLAPNVQGNPALAATAAQAIRSTALVGLDQTPATVEGYKVDLSDLSNPSYQVISTQEELLAAVGLMRDSTIGDFWDDLEHWAGDLWEGIKNGVTAITQIVVDAVNKVATLAVKIGSILAQGVSIAISGIEQAAHAIAGFFQVVAADVEKVIDWLKALFDFTAIWHTKMALEQALLGLPPVVEQLVSYASSEVSTWFEKHETEINDAIDSVKKNYAGQPLSSLPNFQQPGKPPDDTTPVAGNATTADFNNNVHHNWMQDKMSAYAPTDSPVTPPNTIVTPWQSFVTNAEDAGKDFVTALQDFADAVKILATDPSQIGTLGITDLLDGFEKLVDSALELCDALAQGFLALVDAGVDAVVAMLGTELHLGPINTLWAWMAEAAGYPDDTELTLSGLLALLGAFPCTVIYKLIEGVDSEPFPNGVLPQPQQASGLVGGVFQDMPFGCLLSASILQILYVIPAGIGDWMGNTAPWYLTAATVSLTAIMFVLNNGIPQLTSEQWGQILGTASGVIATIPIIGFMLTGIQAQLVRLGQLIKDSGADVMNLLFTLYGVVRFLFTVAVVALGKLPALSAASGLLLPIPSAFSWLRMSVFRDDEEWAPIFQVASVVMDVIGYVGGGVCQVIYVCTSREALPAPA